MKEAFTFDDVLIVPKFSTVTSRKNVILRMVTKSSSGFKFLETEKLPIISSNMDTVTDAKMARAMIGAGAQACLHRFCSIEDNVKMFREARVYVEQDRQITPMVSIGLGEQEYQRAHSLFVEGADKFVIDVANGAQASVAEQVWRLRDLVGSSALIIVGNFASVEGVGEFIKFLGPYHQIDAVKVGIGPGSACTTRVKTGIGYPQLSAIQEIAKFLKPTSIAVIADGGMRTPGDIAKALGAGAHFVMLGGMLAGTDEAPGEKVYSDGSYTLMTEDSIFLPAFKRYRGSASQESYEIQDKEAPWRTAEGEAFYVPYRGSVKDVLQDIEGGLRSALTYTGSHNLTDFHNDCEFVRVTHSGYIEGTAHGKNSK